MTDSHKRARGVRSRR